LAYISGFSRRDALHSVFARFIGAIAADRQRGVEERSLARADSTRICPPGRQGSFSNTARTDAGAGPLPIVQELEDDENALEVPGLDADAAQKMRVVSWCR
jgi:hypothetical protein